VRLFVYSLLRVGIILACAVVLYLLGMRSWLLWGSAVVVGAMVSFLVLRRQHAEAAQVLSQYDPLRAQRPRFSREAEEDAAYEDAAVDAAGEGSAAGEPAGKSAGEDSEGEADAEEESVDELETPRPGEDGDEVPPARPGEDRAG